MSQPSKPVSYTINAPKWVQKFWAGVQANRYQPVAIVLIAFYAVALLVLPWIWGVATIAAEIAE